MDYLQELDVISEEKMSKLHIICLVIHSGDQVEVALSVDAASTTNASNGFGEMYLQGVLPYFIIFFIILKIRDYSIVMILYTSGVCT